MVYFTGWVIISKLCVALIVGLIILIAYHFLSERGKHINFDWRASLWLWPYFIGLSLISYLGQFGQGRQIIPFGWDCIVICIFSYIIMKVAVYYRLDDKKTQAYIQDLNIAS